MTEEKTPGLLLQAIPYLGQQKILKIFTPGVGLLSLLSRRVKNSALTSPFVLAEWVYKKTNRELYPLVDASLVNGLLDLKTRYEPLAAAGMIAQDVLKTQMAGKYSPELFSLISAVFQKLSAFEHPETLVALFRLKLLAHEGLLSLQASCRACPSPALHLFEGESFCLHHAPHPGWSFQPDEWSCLLELAQSRSFEALKQLAPQKSLHKKIHALFDERTRF